MKSIFKFIILLALVAGCKNTYQTSTSGMEYESSVLILRDNNSEKLEDVVLQIDDQEYPIEKVRREKKILKATKFYVEPGKHSVTVKKGGQVLYEDFVLLGNQETRKIILR